MLKVRDSSTNKNLKQEKSVDNTIIKRSIPKKKTAGAVTSACESLHDFIHSIP